jgi:MFS family permease
MFSALRREGYRWFWYSGLGMTASQGIQQLAIAWLVLDLTDSVGQLGLVIFAQGVPMAVVSFYGGVLADRYDRRTLLVIAQLTTMLNLFTLAVLAMSGLVEVWHVYVSSFGLGIMQAITQPARTALIRSLVDDEDLTNGVALNAIQMHSSRILWPSLAGVLIAVAGIGATLLLSAACSLGGILCLLSIRYLNAEPAPRASTRSPFQQMVEGLRFVQRSADVSTVMKLSLCCGLFGLAYMNLSPAFAKEELGLGSSGAGLFIMSMGLGAIVGSALMLVFPMKDAHRLFIILTGVFGLNLMLQAVNPWLPAAFAIMALFGLANSALVVAGQTFLQISVPQAFLGRVIGLWSLAGGLGFVTSLPLGLLGDAIGLRWAIGGAGLLLFASAVWFGGLTLARPHRKPVLEETPSIGSGS